VGFVNRDVIAVTGAGGYLGGRVSLHLARAGTSVRAIVRHHRPWLDVDGIEQVVGDVADVGAVGAVIHLAAPNEVAAQADPGATTADAIEATYRVVAAAAAEGVARVVLASTMHVYGARVVDGARLTEDLRCEPRHPYAVARLASEHLAAATLAGTDSELVVLRITNGVGAPADPSVDRWTLLVNDLARAAARHGRLVLHTPGLQWRDFIPITDVCRVAAAACDPAAMPAGTYNVGSGVPRTVRDVAELVAAAVEAATGIRPPVEAPAASGPAPEPYVVDISRLTAYGVITDPTPLDVAVAETVDACLSNVRSV
jgi:UDP-glucose 4-epimerase